VYTLHIVSDATGSLASHMINAVLTQFPGLQFTQVYHIFKQQARDIQQTVDSFRRRNHIVFYGLINTESKKLIEAACEKLRIPRFDLTGSLVQFIADHTGVAPVNELSRLHETNEGYFKRIEAMEFTAQHDDGRRLETILLADLVIVGLSRVSKSPTSTYLGSMGYKVANVSIAPETGFPEELRRVKRRTVAFTMQPRALHGIRFKRFEGFHRALRDKGLGPLHYYDMRSIVEEVVYAEREYRKRGYPIVDITGRTVEEIAATVLRLLHIPGKRLDYR
jgi:regulator of PEP synthase PpsR (kinase-PPPase family)